MTRRERHLRIINDFDEKSVRWAMQRLKARHGFDLLTDEAVELLARQVLSDYRRTQEMNARNRAIAEQQRKPAQEARDAD